jgi:hypothetical protein
MAVENQQIPFAIAKHDPLSSGGPTGTKVHGGNRPLSLVTLKDLKGAGHENPNSPFLA